VGVVSEYDDFSDAMLMSVDIENKPEEYKDIIRYLQRINFLESATKQIRMRIAHKSQSYTLIGRLLYFCRRDGILRRAMEKTVVLKLLREFYEFFFRDSLWDELEWKKSLRRDSIGQRCSRIFLNTANVTKCVKHL
jgi:hypothetical protein